jgi:hypothetical protein
MPPPSAASILAALLLLSASSAQPLLREAAWTHRTERFAHLLTHAPGECLPSGEAGEDVELGRTLFRSSALLGGPAARIGMSCQSCHLNGRGNAYFFLEELTDRPGAADVTSEWSSAVRGDGVMNPRSIPDLAGVGRRTTFGSGGETSLEAFVRSVIVEEFQGPPPETRAFDAVIAYLRALDVKNCPEGETRITLADAAEDVRRALAAARASARESDVDSASLAVFAAQEALGRIVERLPARSFARERRVLENLARELGEARAAPDIGAALGAPGWMVRFDATIARLAPRERRTFFNEVALQNALRENARMAADDLMEKLEALP